MMKNNSSVRQINEYRKLKKFIILKNNTILKYIKQYLSYKKNNKDQNVLSLFLIRLDMVIFLSGITSSLLEARQLISHKKVLVNDKIVDLNFFKLKINDTITIKIKTSINKLKKIKSYEKCPNWIKLIINNNIAEKIVLLRAPNQNDSNLILKINDILVIDFLSKNYGIK
jgi:small subunit ribosomal protein S4